MKIVSTHHVELIEKATAEVKAMNDAELYAHLDRVQFEIDALPEWARSSNSMEALAIQQAATEAEIDARVRSVYEWVTSLSGACFR